MAELTKEMFLHTCTEVVAGRYGDGDEAVLAQVAQGFCRRVLHNPTWMLDAIRYCRDTVHGGPAAWDEFKAEFLRQMEALGAPADNDLPGLVERDRAQEAADHAKGERHVLAPGRVVNDLIASAHDLLRRVHSDDVTELEQLARQHGIEGGVSAHRLALRLIDRDRLLAAHVLTNAISFALTVSGHPIYSADGSADEEMRQDITAKERKEQELRTN